MKKKILSLTLVVCLLAIAVVGGTLAYFQDSDSDVNVMTVGNVKIVQNENDRNGDPFVDDKVLVPAVYNGTLDYDENVIKALDDVTYKGFDTTVDGEVDKVITVTNNGTEAAYVRTIILFEAGENNYAWDKLHYYQGSSDGQVFEILGTNENPITVEVDGVDYVVCVATYDTALEAKATSAPSLMQVFLDPTTTDEFNTAVGEEYTILALSQAVQAQGFDTVDEAFEKSFGEVNKTSVEAWFAEV